MQVISLHNNLHFILIEKRERTEGIRYLTPFASGFDIHSMTSNSGTQRNVTQLTK